MSLPPDQTVAYKHIDNLFEKEAYHLDLLCGLKYDI